MKREEKIKLIESYRNGKKSETLGESVILFNMGEGYKITSCFNHNGILFELKDWGSFLNEEEFKRLGEVFDRVICVRYGKINQEANPHQSYLHNSTNQK